MSPYHSWSEIFLYKFLTAALCNNAVFNEIRPVAECFGTAHVVGVRDHRVARLLVKLVEYLHHLAKPVVVLPHSRFVQ